MGSKIVLKNDINSEFSISHLDAIGSKILSTSDFKYIRDTMKDMLELNGKLEDGDIIFLKGYHTVNDGGGGTFVYDANGSKEDHNGGTIIDLSKAFPGDWSNQDGLNDWFNNNIIGNGVLKRIYSKHIDVKWFGAKGDKKTNDTLAFQKTVAVANSDIQKVFIPAGTYALYDTITICNGFTGVSLIGQSKKTTTLISHITDATKPLIDLIGGSGLFNNVEISDIYIVQNDNNKYTATALHLNGVGNVKVNRLEIDFFNYGIWLHNKDVGNFTEVNNFDDIVLNYCTNGIRLEQGDGENSFHGNNFNNIYINIGDNQIGFNAVSGYYYNGRFRLFMWCSSSTGTLLNTTMNCENLIGDFTYEVSNNPKITGTGRFWFNGTFTGVGNVLDDTTYSSERVFACDNYIKHELVSELNYTAISMWENINQYTTTSNGMYGLVADNVTSTLLTGYAYGNNAKLFLGQVDYEKSIQDCNIGLHMTYNGSEIKSYNSNGISFKTSDNTTVLYMKNGRFYGNQGKVNDSVIIEPSSNDQTITIPNVNYNYENMFFLITLRLFGNSFEYRKIYAANHQGFGGNGVLTLLASGYEVSNNDVNVKSVSLDSDANLVITINTSITVEAIVYSNGIGLL